MWSWTKAKLGNDKVQTPINVLILCTANSARSILGEALLNRLGEGRVRGFSAGSYPRGTPNPHGISLLADLDYPVDTYRSKSWDEFAKDDAPHMDIVITVCDSAAGESCPLWPGQPVKAHWGIADPAGIGETDAQKRAAFLHAYENLEARIKAMIALPLQTMNKDELQHALAQIGSMAGATKVAIAQAAI